MAHHREDPLRVVLLGQGGDDFGGGLEDGHVGQLELGDQVVGEIAGQQVGGVKEVLNMGVGFHGFADVADALDDEQALL
ncbi:MAG: hypothetical protein ABFS17_10620 [Chloroflexota bacterium]